MPLLQVVRFLMVSLSWCFMRRQMPLLLTIWGLIPSAHVILFPSISFSLICITLFSFDIALCPFDHFLHCRG
ncbi:hypothetical protein A2U01_0075361, partial [Trifolium medium]|nr:hypothetical protein [Trifolium medium]